MLKKPVMAYIDLPLEDIVFKGLTKLKDLIYFKQSQKSVLFSVLTLNTLYK